MVYKRFSINKRTALIVLMAAAMLMCGIITVSAASKTSAKVKNASGRVNASAGAHLRSSASTGARQIALIKNNTKVTIISERFTSKTSTKADTRWYYVKVSGKKGYIRSDLVDHVKYTAVSGKTTAPLNYRKGPGTEMERKGYFKKNAAVKVVLKARLAGSKTLWYKVRKGLRYYYVSSDYVKLTASKTKTAAAAKASSSSKSSKTSSTAKTTTKSTKSSKTTQSAGTSKSTATKSSSSASASEASSSAETVKPVVTAEGITYPVSLGQGAAFTLKGTITSNVTIESVRAGITDSTGSWVVDITEYPDSTVFNVSKVDSQIRFGKLQPGTYRYKLIINAGGKSFTRANYCFIVKKVSAPTLLANTAISLAWPAGTAQSAYTYGKGSARGNYKDALDTVFPDHGKGQASSGASCDMFISTLIRYSGYDTSVPTGVQGQWKYYAAATDKWNRVNYHYSESDLQPGDVIIYKKTNGNWHVCMYVKVDDKGCIAEASYTRKLYAHINTSLSKILKSSDKKQLCVYRATPSEGAVAPDTGTGTDTQQDSGTADGTDTGTGTDKQQ